MKKLQLLISLALLAALFIPAFTSLNRAAAVSPGNNKPVQSLTKKGNYANIPVPNEDYYKDSIYIEGDLSRLASLIKKAEAGEDLVIVGFGGSITQGTNDKTYGHLVSQWFRDTYPDINVTYYNAGIGATGSVVGAERVERDVINRNPDLVLIDFSVNDSGLDYEKEAYESFLRKILDSDSKPAVIHFAMAQFAWMENKLRNVQDMHGEICDHYGVPVFSLVDALNGKLDWPEYIPDTIHPNDYGHEIIGSIIMMRLADIRANLDSIDEPDYKMPHPVMNDGFKDIVFYGVKDITPDEMGDWEIKSNHFVCSVPNGKRLLIQTDYSYLILRYVAHDKGDAKLKIVVDGNHEEATYIENNSGFYFHLLTAPLYEMAPGCHWVEFIMESGSDFEISGIYAANFAGPNHTPGPKPTPGPTPTPEPSQEPSDNPSPTADPTESPGTADPTDDPADSPGTADPTDDPSGDEPPATGDNISNIWLLVLGLLLCGFLSIRFSFRSVKK